MPWFKVDERFHDNRKARNARKAAIGVWTFAGSWSTANHEDGFVPAAILPRWGTRSDAGRLVEAGLWEPSVKEGEPGWQFINWNEYQPIKADIEAAAEKKGVGGMVGNHTRWHVNKGIVNPECEFCVVSL